jgi:hypothetical protein
MNFAKMFGFTNMPAIPSVDSFANNPHWNHMQSSFGAFMQNFAPANAASASVPVNEMKNVAAMPKLTADSDVARWFQRYKLVLKAKNRRLNQDDMLEMLPLYLDAHVTNVFRKAESENRMLTLETAEEYFTVLFADRATERSWQDFHATVKSPLETFEAFALRCKASFDDIERQTGCVAPPHMLTDKMINNTPIASRSLVASLPNFEAIVSHLRGIDKVNRQQQSQVMNVAVAQELQRLRDKVRQLETTKTVAVNQATRTPTPAAVDKYIPPDHKIGNNRKQKTRFEPRQQQHLNSICYNCGDPNANHLSYDCPYRANSRRPNPTDHHQQNQRNGHKRYRRHSPEREDTRQRGDGGARTPCDICGKLHFGECNYRHIFERGKKAQETIQAQTAKAQTKMQPTKLFPEPHKPPGMYTMPYPYPFPQPQPFFQYPPYHHPPTTTPQKKFSVRMLDKQSHTIHPDRKERMQDNSPQMGPTSAPDL